MGMRLHVATKYRVEYSDFEAFNWKQSEFANLLDAVGIQYISDYEWTTFEFFREDMERLIEAVRTSGGAMVANAINDFEMPREEIALSLKQLLEVADKNDEIIHLKFL